MNRAIPARRGLADGLRGPAWTAAFFLFVAAGYAVASLVANAWFQPNGLGPSFFPAAGWTLGLLALSAGRWPTILAAAATAEIAVDLAMGLALPAAVGFAVANTVEPLVGATLMRRMAGRRVDLSRVSDMLVFLGAAVVTAPLVGAAVGAVVDQWFGAGRDWAVFVGRWWLGDGLGVLVVGGTLLALAGPTRLRSDTWPVAVAAATAIGAGTAVVFWTGQIALAGVIVLGMVALASWQPIGVVASAGAAGAFVAAEAEARGGGFAERLGVDAAGAHVQVQLVIFVVLATVLVLAAQVGERERAATARRAAEIHGELAERGERRQRLAGEVAERVIRPIRSTERTKELAHALVPVVADVAVVLGHGVDGTPEVQAVAHAHPGSATRLWEEAPALAERLGARQVLADGATRHHEVVTAEVAGPELRSVVLTPMTARSGRVLGVLLVGHGASGRRFRREDARLLEQIALHAALAVENSRLHEFEHDIAAALQTSMLPAVTPSNRHVVTAARYLPGSQQLAVGGDWYDLLARPDDTMTVAVGDVVGHGLGAAATMGQMRSAAAALITAGLDTGDVLSGLDQFAARLEPARYSTACCARLDPEAGRLWFSSAGHPAPLLIAPDGTARFLTGGHSPVLSAPAPVPRPQAVVALPAGSTLLFYTDGLIEQDRRPADGASSLVAAARRHVALEPDAFCQQILDSQLGSADPRDDVALVCLRYLGTLESPPGGAEAEEPASGCDGLGDVPGAPRSDRWRAVRTARPERLFCHV